MELKVFADIMSVNVRMVFLFILKTKRFLHFRTDRYIILVPLYESLYATTAVPGSSQHQTQSAIAPSALGKLSTQLVYRREELYPAGVTYAWISYRDGVRERADRRHVYRT